MAGNENSGGYRPGAPQNNPMNINALGGNGQSGMTTDYTGFAYGKNKEINEQRKGAMMQGQASAPAPTGAAPAGMVLPEVIPLDAPTQRPNEPVTYGSAMGPGPGEEILGLPSMGTMYQPDSGIAAVRAMYAQDPSNQDLKRMLEYAEMRGTL